MFETARVHTAQRHIGILTVSAFAHVAIVAAVIAASVASTRLPVDPPRQMMPLVVAPPLPLAAGSPAPVHPKPKPAPVHAAPRPPVVVTTPQSIPDHIVPPLPATPAPVEDTISTSTSEGVRDGVPGGLPPELATAPPPSPDAAGPLRVVGDVKAPVVIRRVEPVYPRVALFAHMNGWVNVECIIDRSGHVRDVQVIGSSFPAFEQSAVAAVQQWVFSPGTLNGRPVDTIFDLRVRFEVR